MEESSLKPFVEINGCQLQLVSEDHRRRIWEFNGPEESIQYVEVTADHCVVLGNHFHKNRNEEFKILEGGGVLSLQVVYAQNGVPMLLGVHQHLLGPGCAYRAAPQEAHAFYLIPGTRMISWTNGPWDPQDDHKYLLVAP